jgi:serine/threonine protein kinase
VLPSASRHATSLDDSTARFRREAQVLAALNHPNIATIHGLEEADGVRALVLELVDGPTLADRVLAGPIPLEDAVSIARQIAVGSKRPTNRASSIAISSPPTSSCGRTGQ